MSTTTIFLTAVNAYEEVSLGEVSDLPSMTQPDELMSIQEMLDRYVRGLPVHGGQGFSDLPEELGYVPDFRSLDLTEIDDYRRVFADRVTELRSPPLPPSGSAADTPLKGGVVNDTSVSSSTTGTDEVVAQ